MADLPDSELVAELQQYGETVSLPIKPKQRPILVKKLNHLRVRNKKQNDVAKASLNLDKRRRSGASTNSISNATTSTASIASAGSHHQYRPNASTRSRANLDTLSSDDSDVEAIPDVHRKSFDRSPNPSRQTGRGRNNQLSDSVLRTLRRRTGDHRTDDTKDQFTGNHKRGRQSIDEGENHSFPSPSRSRLYPDLPSVNSSFAHNRSDDTFESSDSDGEQGSSYYVESKSMNTSFASQVGDRESAGNHRRSFIPSPSSSSPSLDSSPSHTRYSYGGRNRTSRIQPYKSRFSDFLPKILIGLVIVFFTVLSFTYVILHKDFFFAWFSHSVNVGSNDNWLVCKDQVHNGCYEKAEIHKALIYIKRLYEELSVKKGNVVCEQEPEGNEVISAAVLKLKIDSISFAETQSSRLYECCIQHILANRHWNIRALRQDGTDAQTLVEVYSLESAVASMGFLCRLQRSFVTVVYGLFLFCLFIFGGLLLSFYIKYRIKAKEKEDADVFMMVEKIIELLQEHHDQVKGDDSDGAPYLAVQHVRDQLLPPAERRQLQPVWDRAVAFISENESRIRLETKIIRGEEFDVWHWLQPAHNNGKIWQGLAFGENSLSNEIIYSPSPCLKIRNMFDSAVESEEDWEDGVVDAILEKCSSIPAIVHIYVDTNSAEGCVYLKCLSCEAAGKVRKALNSWWFDGRLVTVKYLKADYYHKRWPESRSATRPLKPSTNQMRSLSQQHMYRSSLEMT